MARHLGRGPGLLLRREDLVQLRAVFEVEGERVQGDLDIPGGGTGTSGAAADGTLWTTAVRQTHKGLAWARRRRPSSSCGTSLRRSAREPAHARTPTPLKQTPLPKYASPQIHLALSTLTLD